MNKYAVIVAGGTGSRMNNPVPKQFLLLNNKPLLYYTLDTFLKAYDDMQIILVLPEEHVARGQEIIDAYFDYNRIKITVGGRTRFHSVQNGLAMISGECMVFVHDAVRCLLSVALIQRCYEAALVSGAAIPVVDCNDSVRFVSERGNEALERRHVKLVQTPQVFLSTILIPAYNIDYKDKFTDEASVVEAFGMKVQLVEGEEDNIKITKAVDIMVAEQLMAKKQEAMPSPD